MKILLNLAASQAQSLGYTTWLTSTQPGITSGRTWTSSTWEQSSIRDDESWIAEPSRFIERPGDDQINTIWQPGISEVWSVPVAAPDEGYSDISITPMFEFETSQGSQSSYLFDQKDDGKSKTPDPWKSLTGQLNGFEDNSLLERLRGVPSLPRWLTEMMPKDIIKAVLNGRAAPDFDLKAGEAIGNGEFCLRQTKYYLEQYLISDDQDWLDTCLDLLGRAIVWQRKQLPLFKQKEQTEDLAKLVNNLRECFYLSGKIILLLGQSDQAKALIKEYEDLGLALPNVTAEQLLEIDCLAQISKAAAKSYLKGVLLIGYTKDFKRGLSLMQVPLSEATGLAFFFLALKNGETLLHQKDRLAEAAAICRQAADQYIKDGCYRDQFKIAARLFIINCHNEFQALFYLNQRAALKERFQQFKEMLANQTTFDESEWGAWVVEVEKIEEWLSKNSGVECQKALEAYLDGVYLVFVKKDLAKALTCFEFAITLNTHAKNEFSFAYFRAGLTSSWLGRNSEAEFNLRKAVELDPAFINLKYYLAGQLSLKQALRVAEREEIIALLLECRKDEQYQSDPLVLEALALQYIDLGETKKALATYEELELLGKLNEVTKARLGQLRQGMHILTQAQDANTCEIIKKRVPDASSNQPEVIATIIADCQKFLEQIPHYAPILVQYGLILAKARQEETALEQLELALDHCLPSSTVERGIQLSLGEVHLALALKRADQKNTAEAKENITQAEAHFNLALKLAQELLKQGLGDRTNNQLTIIKAYCGLASLEANLKDQPKEAVKYYLDALVWSPNNEAILNALGLIIRSLEKSIPETEATLLAFLCLRKASLKGYFEAQTNQILVLFSLQSLQDKMTPAEKKLVLLLLATTLGRNKNLDQALVELLPTSEQTEDIKEQFISQILSGLIRKNDRGMANISDDDLVGIYPILVLMGIGDVFFDLAKTDAEQAQGFFTFILEKLDSKNERAIQLILEKMLDDEPKAADLLAPALAKSNGLLLPLAQILDPGYLEEHNLTALKPDGHFNEALFKLLPEYAPAEVIPILIAAAKNQLARAKKSKVAKRVEPLLIVLDTLVRRLSQGRSEFENLLAEICDSSTEVSVVTKAASLLAGMAGRKTLKILSQAFVLRLASGLEVASLFSGLVQLLQKLPLEEKAAAEEYLPTLIASLPISLALEEDFSAWVELTTDIGSESVGLALIDRASALVLPLRKILAKKEPNNGEARSVVSNKKMEGRFQGKQSNKSNNNNVNKPAPEAIMFGQFILAPLAIAYRQQPSRIVVLEKLLPLILDAADIIASMPQAGLESLAGSLARLLELEDSYPLMAAFLKDLTAKTDLPEQLELILKPLLLRVNEIEEARLLEQKRRAQEAAEEAVRLAEAATNYPFLASEEIAALWQATIKLNDINIDRDKYFNGLLAEKNLSQGLKLLQGKAYYLSLALDQDKQKKLIESAGGQTLAVIEANWQAKQLAALSEDFNWVDWPAAQPRAVALVEAAVADKLPLEKLQAQLKQIAKEQQRVALIQKIIKRAVELARASSLFKVLLPQPQENGEKDNGESAKVMAIIIGPALAGGTELNDDQLKEILLDAIIYKLAWQFPKINPAVIKKALQKGGRLSGWPWETLAKALALDSERPSFPEWWSDKDWDWLSGRYPAWPIASLEQVNLPGQQFNNQAEEINWQIEARLPALSKEFPYLTRVIDQAEIKDLVGRALAEGLSREDFLAALKIRLAQIFAELTDWTEAAVLDNWIPVNQLICNLVTKENPEADINEIKTALGRLKNVVSSRSNRRSNRPDQNGKTDPAPTVTGISTGVKANTAIGPTVEEQPTIKKIPDKSEANHSEPAYTPLMGVIQEIALAVGIRNTSVVSLENRFPNLAFNQQEQSYFIAYHIVYKIKMFSRVNPEKITEELANNSGCLRGKSLEQIKGFLLEKIEKSDPEWVSDRPYGWMLERYPLIETRRLEDAIARLGSSPPLNPKAEDEFFFRLEAEELKYSFSLAYYILLETDQLTAEALQDLTKDITNQGQAMGACAQAEKEFFSAYAQAHNFFDLVEDKDSLFGLLIAVKEKLKAYYLDCRHNRIAIDSARTSSLMDEVINEKRQELKALAEEQTARWQEAEQKIQEDLAGLFNRQTIAETIENWLARLRYNSNILPASEQIARQLVGEFLPVVAVNYPWANELFRELAGEKWVNFTVIIEQINSVTVGLDDSQEPFSKKILIWAEQTLAGQYSNVPPTVFREVMGIKIWGSSLASLRTALLDKVPATEENMNEPADPSEETQEVTTETIEETTIPVVDISGEIKDLFIKENADLEGAFGHFPCFFDLVLQEAEGLCQKGRRNASEAGQILLDEIKLYAPPEGDDAGDLVVALEDWFKNKITTWAKRQLQDMVGKRINKKLLAKLTGFISEIIYKAADEGGYSLSKVQEKIKLFLKETVPESVDDSDA